MSLTIRAAGSRDEEAIWAMLEPVFRAGDTYAVDTDISRQAALAYWFGASHGVFLAEREGVAAGTYYLRRNQGGGGAHVCNCGYITGVGNEGRGVGRAMLDHSIRTARSAGFRAMQFNFVVSSNKRAINLWQRSGFECVGRLTDAFHHPDLGFVDALVMSKNLQ